MSPSFFGVLSSNVLENQKQKLTSEMGTYLVVFVLRSWSMDLEVDILYIDIDELEQLFLLVAVSA